MNNKCITDVSNAKIISLKDKRSSSLKVLNNLTSETTIHQIQIDGCWDCNVDDKKCDYKLSVVNNSDNKCTLFYIELKGSNYTQALQQIYSTLKLFPNEKREYKIGLVILSRAKNVDINSTTAQVLQTKLKHEYKMVLSHKCSPAEYCLLKERFVN
ncbi:hypothetical protein ROV62_10250 [Pasteurella multocida]|uniref:hypothetical protein n=1 Tax=Pasteurella multocida TaxID=747 RepID=UPI002CF5A4CA|nr:hypothetical protein [Pasteurella multocida]MEB3504328.1 hypothetical protein [Pasteurella multocida]